ncbi:SMP-30/gluconolactonase/LRE family protein [Erwinia papayae]|uniref:SMP-30/gluconolactonase/LRE family protein n=1 Tax=Erwinia papayae TaxID=206499 RepID=A0ABV3N0Q0_9GAMM
MIFSAKQSAAALLGGIILSNVCHAEATQPQVKIVAEQPEFSSLINSNSTAQLLTDKAVWAEGPACLHQGDFIFSDVKQNKVMRWSEQKGLEVWLSPSHYQNGHAVDTQGRVIAASHGQRAVLRQEHDGRWVTLASTWQGKKLNSPNDVIVAPDGAIWFTDPTFGVLNKAESYGGNPEQDGEYLYRYDTNTKTLSRMNTPEVHSPNGLAFSPDGKRLYVADTQIAHDFSNQKLAHQIVTYRVNGTHLEEGRIFAKVSPGILDGIKVDEKGNVWSSSKEGVQVYSPQGMLLGKILIPASNTGNLALCTDAGNRHWLYVTAASLVLRMPVMVGNSTEVAANK